MEGQLPNSPSAVPPPPVVPPTTPPPAAPAAPVAKKGTSPILLAILGVVIVGGMAFAALTFWQKGLLGGFLAKPTPTPTLAPEPSPTPDPTADWKTYSNTQYGFSIKYPSDRILIERSQPVVEFIFSKDKSLDPLATIFLRIDENTKNLTLRQWVDGNFKNYPETLLKDIRREKTTLGGVEAEKIYLPGEGASWQVVGLKNNRFYTLSVNSEINPSGEEKNNWNYFNLMLSTFEFLTPTPTGTQTKGGITQEAGTPVKIKSISLVSPTKGPLVIKGTVDPGWMFEGVMPVKLLDSSRQEIATGSAKETIPGSWQSGKAVEFSVSLTFATESASGFLVFKNDNPSGLPSNQKSFELPVKFRQH